MVKKKKSVKAKPSRLLWKLFAVGSLLAIVALIYLDAQVRYNFDERRWQLPARVYARPLVLDLDTRLRADDLAYELKLLGYRPVRSARSPGTVSRNGETFEIVSRATKPLRFRVSFNGNRIKTLATAGGRKLSSVSFEPVTIGSIYPGHREDRELLRFKDVPQILIDILLLVEDRDFYQHFGLSPKSIARAALANLKAGRTVQGGSTLTQQLVKNVFLDRDRSFFRKGVEALMSLLLEFHYSKTEILEAYINEIYLGQEGAKAIHGFALASRHYFNRPLHELRPEQVALLVGLVKGPSYYDPWRHQQRAIERRNVVLAVMEEHELISEGQAVAMSKRPLALAKASAIEGVHPAYLDLVRRQLKRDYSHQQLSSEGLQIYTAFDPIVQRDLEQSIKPVIAGMDKAIETAVVVTDIESSGVVAMVGGRRSHYAGFNRALDAVRPVGSLIKPAVYLAALEQSDQYSLATPLSDRPVRVMGRDDSLWQPKNFDRKSHGDVLLYQALSHSYNQATARLGMQLGLTEVLDVVRRLGVQRQPPKVPAMLLGAGALSPIEVASMYQTIAARGRQTALRSIVEIKDQQGKLLARYPVQAKQQFAEQPMFLLHHALQKVMQEGTGKAAYQLLSEDYTLAGKTGTTNDSRDSWFAGFAGDYLAVVWMGRDDNGATQLTGSSGALKIWRQLFQRISHRPLNIEMPDNIEERWVDSQSGVLSGRACANTIELPFIAGSEPKQKNACAKAVSEPWQWLKRLFN
jgi:penicillin-binding protein 1B